MSSFMENLKKDNELVWHDLNLLKLCCIVFIFSFVSGFHFPLLQAFFKAFCNACEGMHGGRSPGHFTCFVTEGSLYFYYSLWL